MSQSKKQSQVSFEFSLQGQFIEFKQKQGKLTPSFYLATKHREYLIKLSKDLQAIFGEPTTLNTSTTVLPGSWMKVSVIQTVDFKQGKVTLKAHNILMLHKPPREAHPADVDNLEAAPSLIPFKANKVKADKAGKTQTILVCQKAKCCQQGAKELTEALRDEVGDRGLNTCVSVKASGCLGHCSAAPAVMMPDKKRYQKVKLKDVPKLIDRYYPEPLPKQG